MADNADPGVFADFKYYYYDPSLAAAIIFLLLFLGTTSYHGWQMWKGRVWYYIPLVLGGLFEVIGFIGRAASSQQTPDWTLGPYIIQSLFLLLAPALFAASIYMELGRLILVIDAEKYSPIPKRWLTKIFVAGDVLSFMMQGAGGGLLAVAKTEDEVSRGENVIIGGLFVQIVFFTVFVVVSCLVHFRIHKQPTAASLSPNFPWLKHQYALYGGSVLILIRSVFRAIEYIQGNGGYLLSHEAFLYVFDSLLMFLVLVIFNIYHGGEIKKMLGGAKEPSTSHELAQNYNV
ncbi:RTA1-domain-containing protein [Corynespora cassiicola Philippines]|uniref:RTA1-domain-containing protein n=1 Tax=Corynespora cassiicola Philippines TaxID=1448308 RepID=A0A2T2N4S1_CORCC|nr:RTA1-domain-containing protein [Corynespora cassiicola Philippines]